VCDENKVRAGHDPLMLFGSQLRHLASGFLAAAPMLMISLGTTGEKSLECGAEKEETIYEFDGAPEDPVPMRTITCHGQNSAGAAECIVEFRFYANTHEGPNQLIRTDVVKAGASTASRTARWTSVTVKCTPSPVEKGRCHIAWTIGA
jgi:hypothetical protein